MVCGFREVFGVLGSVCSVLAWTVESVSISCSIRFFVLGVLVVIIGRFEFFRFWVFVVYFMNNFYGIFYRGYFVSCVTFKRINYSRSISVLV